VTTTPEDKLRLGGMALRNGLLVHGPTSWAAAVRTEGGEIKAASGRKPRLRAADGIPGVRGVARLAEAMAVIPVVKRGLPEARLPFQDPGVLAVAAGSPRLTSGITANASASRATPRTPGIGSTARSRGLRPDATSMPPSAPRTAAAQWVGPWTSRPLRRAIPPRRILSAGVVT